MRKIIKEVGVGIFVAGALLFTSCSEDDTIVNDSFDIPSTFSFTREGESTVSFGGQTTRIAMAEELVPLLVDFHSTESSLRNMFSNASDPFSDADLNDSGKQISNTIASSEDYFEGTTDVAIRTVFEDFLKNQVNEVFPNEAINAAAGVAGQYLDGSTTRYVNGNGLEYNQMFAKGLIGALMLDQILNNYISPSLLDEGTNRADNDAGTWVAGKTYTQMEHFWDEAYGYLYGASGFPETPNQDLEQADQFLNRYLGRVDNDPDFTGIADRIFTTFLTGRAAIVAGNYTARDAQIEILREELSKVIAIRSVYYLQQAKLALEVGTQSDAFHDLSEAYGFIYSLQFTRQPGTDSPYFTKSEVDGFLSDLLGDGANGLWNVKINTLDDISTSIATKFGISVAEAGS